MRQAMPFGAPVLAIAIILFAASLAADAQPARAVARVGLLSSGKSAGPTGPFAFLKQRLHEAGWIEGKNVEFQARFAEGVPSRLGPLAQDLVRLGVDVIVTASNDETRAAKAATASTPIVMVATSDPVAAGFVESLARPGGNTTGTTVALPELWGKRLALMREIVPSMRRVALLWNPAVFRGGPILSTVEASARQLGVTVRSVEIMAPTELPAVFAVMKRDGFAAILLVASSDLYPHLARIAELAIDHGLPLVGSFPQEAEAGALFSYGTNILELYRRAANYVDRILRGARPATLPIERPTTFDLVVNLKTAKALGLTSPRSLLLQADRVIE